MKLLGRLALVAAATLILGACGSGLQASPASPSSVTEGASAAANQASSQDEILLEVLSSFGMNVQGQAGTEVLATARRVCKLRAEGVDLSQLLQILAREGYADSEAAWMFGAADAKYCRAAAAEG